MPEVMSYAPPEAMTPRPQGEVESNEAKVEKKQVDLGKLNPTPETVMHNWEVLGDLSTAGKEDLKLELLKSLNEPDEAFNARGKEAIAKRDDPENPDPADFNKIRHIVVLRKMLAGQDWRAEGAAEEARNYINQKLEKISHDITGLGKVAPQTEIIANTIKVLQAELGELAAAQNKLDEIIQAGYPELWKKFKPEEKELTKEELEAIRLEHLQDIIEQKLPAKYKKFAEQITQTLAGSGFNFVEREIKTGPKNREQITTRTTIFLDPLKKIESKILQAEINKTQHRPYDQGVRRFKELFRAMIKDSDLTGPPLIAFNSLLENGNWDYPQRADAEKIITTLHKAEKKPYAIYMSDPGYTGSNLLDIEKTSGDVAPHARNVSATPDYRDGTVFIGSPTFTFENKHQ